VIASKECDKSDSKKWRTYSSALIQANRHILPNFGALRPAAITTTRWKDYDQMERRNGRKALFNTRKLMVEILRRAADEGLIQRLPELPNLDPPAEPPRVIDRATFRKLYWELSPSIRLLAVIMLRQGARPREVLQYTWRMIDFKKGKHGWITIPGEITKTGRTRSIPLNPAVSQILARQKRETASPWVFPNRKGTGPVKTYAKVWDRACDEVGVDFDIYNLRDTFITEKLAEGLSTVFIAKYVDNSALMIERKYAVPLESAMEQVAK
jgi:integrase